MTVSAEASTASSGFILQARLIFGSRLPYHIVPLRTPGGRFR